MRRRHFLTVSASTIGGLLIFTLDRQPERVHAQSSKKIRVPLYFFDENEALIIAAAVARVFPSDETGPVLPRRVSCSISTGNWPVLGGGIDTGILTRPSRPESPSKAIKVRLRRESCTAKG